jgi:hypothetical protein
MTPVLDYMSDFPGLYVVVRHGTGSKLDWLAIAAKLAATRLAPCYPEVKAGMLRKEESFRHSGTRSQRNNLQLSRKRHPRFANQQRGYDADHHRQP